MKHPISLLLVVFTMFSALAQNKKAPVAVPKPPAQAVGIDASVAGMKMQPGFFDFYYDEKTDKTHLVVTKIDQEFLYVQSLTAAIGSNDIGLDRNQLGRERVVKFERRGPKLLLIEPNTFYRANSTNVAEVKAVEQSFAQSVLFGFSIEAEEPGKWLIDVSDFLLQDAHDVAGRLKSSNQGSYSLDKSRSALYIERTKNFPQNTEFEVTLTFVGQATGEYIKSVVPTPSAITVRQHHSFVQLPDGNFKPRKFDPRAGYFNLSYYDYATHFSEPLEQRFITRHRLEKKNPYASVSEAVKPIIYYVDPGAPEQVRNALIEGASWWNQAFEAAGYKNAFQVKVLPEEADPMDVRYNVINWVHRSTRGWSYGSSVTDPRTGEIIKGHVSLGSLRDRQDYLIFEGLLAPYEKDTPLSKELERLVIQRLKQLSAHEVGHTLGLAHAYSSSAEGRASVMDYPQPYVKLVNGKIDATDAYTNEIGAWDKVAINFGYQDFPPGTDESKALNEIIQKSLKAGLTFLSDQDARPRGSAHPYTHLWDNGKDAADELNRMLELRAVVLKNVGEKSIKEGTAMAQLEEVLVPMYFYHRYQVEAAAKLIGGLNYRYALKGDGQLVTDFISAAQQEKALDALLKSVAPSSLMLPERLLAMIPPRPLGYERHREVIKIKTGLTFDALALAEEAADITLGMVLRPERTNRLVEHHARNPTLPSLEGILDKLINATIKAPAKAGYEGAVQMTTNHALFVCLAVLLQHKEASVQSKAIARYKLNQAKTWLASQASVVADYEWKAHYSYLSSEINQLLTDPKAYKPENLLEAPPGQPIGMETEYCGN
jgi:hypothetical protein